MVFKHLFGSKKSTETEGKQEAQNVTPATAGQAPQQEPPKDPPVASELEQAMVENVRTDTRETRQRVYQELLFSELLLALAEAETKGEQTTNEINVAILSNPQNVKFAAAFTSAEAARRWRPEGGNYATIRGQDLYRLLEPSPAEVLVVNAGSNPMIVLPKVEYRQLAAGVTPQSQQSPVQSPSAGGAEGQQKQDEAPQIVFDEEVFTPALREQLSKILASAPRLEAAAVAFMVPPGTDPNKNRQRTVFLRTKDVEQTQEAMQAFFEAEIQPGMGQAEADFRESPFQFFPIPDPSFWIAVHRHKAALFDRNPPDIPEEISFRADAFNDDQKAIIEKVLKENEHMIAAAVGGILPPEADPRNGWVRAVFVRVQDLNLEDTKAVNEYFGRLHSAVASHQHLFKDVSFTFRVMGDPNFWVNCHQNQTVLFDNNPPPAQVEMAFPPDVMTDAQKAAVHSALQPHQQLEAASIGAILPPGADKEKGWIRTVFVRAIGVDTSQEAVQQFCASLRDAIREAHAEDFKETGFEVGLMPDPSFWEAMHKNNLVLFDKAPPAVTPES